MTGRQLARAQRRARARAETKRPRYERAVRKEIRDGLRLAARRFESRATVHLTASDGPGWTPPASDELVTVEELVDSFAGSTDPIRRSAVSDYFAAFGASAGGVNANWETTNPLIGSLIEQTGSQVVNVADTTRTSIAGVISRSYDAGLSVQDTAAAIRAYADSISNARATLIARTEFNRLVNGSSLTATQIVADATDSSYVKVWRTAPGAEYPRHDDYPDLDGQTVALDALFEVGDDQLAYPGDPDGEPGETCNCRCSLEYVEAKGEELAPADVSVSQDSLAAMIQSSPQELAATAFAQAGAAEPGVTFELAGVVRENGGSLAGLEAKFKTQASLARKIADDAAKKGITDAESASQIVDALRYTMVVEPGEYAAAVERTLADLRGRGFVIERVKNYWGGSRYNGINVVVQTRGGYSFELQFHTALSREIKEQAHLLLDQLRELEAAGLADSSEYRAIESEIEALWADFPIPPGAERIGEPRTS